MLTNRHFLKRAHEIQLFCCNYSYIYLYGAGVFARGMMLFLHESAIHFCGCCVTSKGEEKCCFLGIEQPVYRLHEIPQPLEQCGFIFAMEESSQQEVISILERQGIHINSLHMDNYFLRYYQEYARFVESLPSDNQQRVMSQAALLSAENAVTSCGNQAILITRIGGLGDVLCVEPIVRKLTEQKYHVYVETMWRELFQYNHSALGTFTQNAVPPSYRENALAISCMNAYEMRPLVSMIDAYIDTVSAFIPGFTLSEEERIPIFDRKLIRNRSTSSVKKICINIEASRWDCRIFDIKKMRKFVSYLKRKGCDIFEIGVDEEYYLGIGKNCYGMALHDTVKLMSEMDLYVGMDNGLMHLAQAIRLPIFILFGAICPNFRIYDWSRARVMWKNVDKLPCAACYHRRMIPCREPQCHWDTVRCMDWSVEEVIEAFETEKYDNPPKLQDEMYKPIWWNDIS